MQRKVENLCKTMRQTMCNLSAKICGYIKSTQISVENHNFTHIFSLLSTKFSTENSSLFLRNLFHFSTTPTITTNIK